MKILAIRIKNLASLEGTTEIDFSQEPLCSAGIFAITGPTGAGKSTILDALCLALYARTPRYDKSNDPNQKLQDIAGNTITQSDPRKILRDGAADGYAEVDFMGLDGHRHRAQWSVRRARNKVEGALQAYQVTCMDLDAGTNVQGTKTEVLNAISRLIGLSFEQFTRAVLLAQGDFTAFLKAPTSEKSELLEKLTGTQIYTEISKRVFERHRAEKEELHILQVQKEGINVLNEEDLEILNNRKTELSTLLQEQQKNEEALAKELAWHEKGIAFQKAIDESAQAFKHASEQKKEAAPREILLVQVEAVQAARTWVEGLSAQRQLFSERESKQRTIEAEILQLQEQRKQQEATLKNAQQKLLEKTTEQEQAQSLLTKAKQLDVQLKDRATQRETTEAEVQQSTTAYSKHQQHIQTLQQQAEQLQAKINKLTAYIQQNESRKALVENEKLILTSLSDARTLLQEEQQALSNIYVAQQLLESQQEQENKQAKVLEQARELEQSLLALYTQLQASVAATDIPTLQKNKSETDAQVLELVQAAADWKTLFEATTLLEKNKVTLQTSKQELKNKREQLQHATTVLEIALIRKDAASRSLEMARKESAENVVSLREQLTEEQPCPVCGSTEHPYAMHDPRVDNILAKLEADFKEQETAHYEALHTQSTLQQTIKQLESDITRLAEEQTFKEPELKEYRESWKRFSRYSEADNNEPANTAMWLKQQLTARQQAQQILQQQLEQAQLQQHELEAHKKRHEKAIEQYRLADNALKDTGRNIQSQKEKLEQAQNEHAKAVQKLAQMQETLAGYFTNANWFDHWKADANTFTKSITSFAATWKANTEQLETTRKAQDVSAATLKGDENKLQILADDVTKKQEAFSTLSQQYQTLLGERKQLFEGRSTAEVEQQLKIVVAQARHALDLHKAQYEQTLQAITRSTTQLDETQKELQRLSGSIQELHNNITQWLDAYNAKHTPALTRAELETLLTLSSDWIATERKALQQLNDALLEAQTVLHQHNTALEKHREQALSEKTMEAVAELLSAARLTLNETNREDAETKLRLRQDDDNRQKAGALLQQIAAKESTVNNWAMLNQVIGSADGKKFSQVAQEYTLDVLLGYSNVQLGMLSKRYVLQRIPQSLGLQVVDQDMGNEVRTVNSLSGGESFLVSLALALGLASLSSSRMQVESLFIDEGFGSLDPNTLNVAMDALERLHNQGRKVGVISHVQEMTERIPVQIKVSKQNGGKSKVEIIGV